MYYYLVQSLKNRLILELQDSFGKHPLYSKLTPFIQNRFAFDERPQFGIVVKNSTANKVSLSADNFMGTIESHVMLAYVGQPTFPIEWVREDLACVRAHKDVFPTAPGVYYIEILNAPTNPQECGHFVVDPLLTQTDELVLRFQSGIEREAQLQNVPVKGTLRLWQNHNYLLTEGKDYEVDYTGATGAPGSLRLIARFAPEDTLTADYRYAAPSIGPVEYSWNQANVSTLPGVVLAFGKRGKTGDKVAVVVYGDRVDTAQAFGGRFDVTFDLDIITRDSTQVEEIADLTVMYLWTQKRAALSTEGIEIVDVSMGGEAEEAYDETADLMYYNASISVQLQSDWEVHQPIPLTFSKVISDIQGGGASNLYFYTHPISPGRNANYERIR